MKSDKVLRWVVLTLIAIGIVYFPVIKKLLHRWNQGDNSYCYLIPAIFVYLCWEKRKFFNFNNFSGSLLGPVLLIVAICLTIIGSLSSLETLLYIGFYLSLVSLGITLYGKRLKYLSFPLFILLFIIPLPPFINRMLTFKLQLLTSYLAVFLMRLSGFSVFRQGNIIDLGITQLQVAEACSGLRYFVSMSVLAILIGYYFLKRLRYRLLLLSLVPFICIIANAIRIYLTAIFYLKGHKELAQGFSHFFSGWFIFLIASIFLILITKFFNKLEKEELSEGQEVVRLDIKESTFNKWYLILFLVIILIGGAAQYFFSRNFFIPKNVNLSKFPLRIDGWYGERLKLSKNILKSLWADEYVYNVYMKEDFPGVIYVFIPYYKYQTTWHTAHTPQSCILGGGWSIIRTGNWRLRVSSNKVIPIKYMWLEKPGARMLATYFFFERGRVITSPWWHKIYLFWDGIVKRRTDGALIRVEMLLENNVSYSQAEKELKKFLVNIWFIINRIW